MLPSSDEYSGRQPTLLPAAGNPPSAGNTAFMEEERDPRAAIEAADATGLVAGEELITQATLMHAALPDEHEAHETIDRLHEEVRSAKPDRAAIERHVGTLRGIPALEATIVTWWDDPKTQRFIADITQIGL